MKNYYTMPEEQLRLWYEQYLRISNLDYELNDLAYSEDVLVEELWLCVVAQELV
jgi:hypothetical protein